MSLAVSSRNTHIQINVYAMSARFPHKVSGFVAFTNSAKWEARKNHVMPEILKEIDTTLMMKLFLSFLGTM